MVDGSGVFDMNCALVGCRSATVEGDGALYDAWLLAIFALQLLQVLGRANPFFAESTGCAQIPVNSNPAKYSPPDCNRVARSSRVDISFDLQYIGGLAFGACVRIFHCPSSLTARSAMARVVASVM